MSEKPPAHDGKPADAAMLRLAQQISEAEGKGDLQALRTALENEIKGAESSTMFDLMWVLVSLLMAVVRSNPDHRIDLMAVAQHMMALSYGVAEQRFLQEESQRVH